MKKRAFLPAFAASSLLRGAAAVAVASLAFAACGGGSGTAATYGSAVATTGGSPSGTSTGGGGGGRTITASAGGGGAGSATTGGGGGSASSGGGAGGGGGSSPCGGACPAGATCGTANGIPVCRTATGIPAFSHVFVIMMENLSLSALQGDISSAPNLQMLMATYASGDDYHGVSHPSLPNYIASTSGDFFGIGCDCQPLPNVGDCSSFGACTSITGNCSCNQATDNLADQLEAAGKTWRALGEGMGTPCNTADDGNTSYAVRHVPYLYYDSVRGDAARCAAHVVDFSALDVSATAPHYQFVAPNLVHDMHDPLVSIHGHTGNIASGDAWLGPVMAQITASEAYTSGGLVLVVWDEDDFSGQFAADDPVPILVASPYASGSGFISHVHADHYAMLATIEDAFGLPRLKNAAMASPLADYFPAQ